jgi:hypothetical protein
LEADRGRIGRRASRAHARSVVGVIVGVIVLTIAAIPIGAWVGLVVNLPWRA